VVACAMNTTEQNRKASLLLLRSCFRTMLKQQVLTVATCEYAETETEGLVFVIHVEDDTATEDHRTPFNFQGDLQSDGTYGEDGFSDAVKVMGDIGRRFSERNPPVQSRAIGPFPG
jgi:hypothetical protein